MSKKCSRNISNTEISMFTTHSCFLLHKKCLRLPSDPTSAIVLGCQCNNKAYQETKIHRMKQEATFSVAQQNQIKVHRQMSPEIAMTKTSLQILCTLWRQMILTNQFSNNIDQMQRLSKENTLFLRSIEIFKNSTKYSQPAYVLIFQIDNKSVKEIIICRRSKWMHHTADRGMNLTVIIIAQLYQQLADKKNKAITALK